MTCHRCGRELSTQEAASYRDRCEDCFIGDSKISRCVTPNCKQAICKRTDRRRRGTDSSNRSN